MDEHTLLTPRIVAEELRFQMRNAGMWTNDPVHQYRYSVTRGSMEIHLSCGDVSAAVYPTTEDLLLSLDGFSDKHIMPIVNEIKRMRGENG